jgi:hypothetical protein
MQKKERKWIYKNYMHYVGSFIVLMMGKMLKGGVFKWWNASFAIIMLWMHLIQALKNIKV